MGVKDSRPSPASAWQARWIAVKRAPRTVVLGGIILLIISGFTWRLWHLQIVRGDYYRERATVQSTRLVRIPASRGLIYDRNGTALVRNVPSFDVIITPAYLPDDKEKADRILAHLAMLLGLRADGNLGERVAEAPYSARYQPIVVQNGADRDTALLVAQEATMMPGVSIAIGSRREYTYGPLVSHLLGFLLSIPGEREEEYVAEGYDPATDDVGSAGVEATYEQALRGQKGERIVEEDVLGRLIRIVEDRAAAIPGNNVYVTLDVELQQVVEDALRKGMTLPDGTTTRAVAIAMDPQTGEILAMVSLPTYDNNLFSEGISTRDWQRFQEDVHRPLVNHAISDRLPPGSVFKIVVAAGALQEGVLQGRYTRLDCPGKIVVPNKYFPNDPGQARPFFCWKPTGHGLLDVVGALANSCDVFFYKTGGGFEDIDFDGLGVAGIAQYAQLFGLGEPTGVELPGEVGGLVPSAYWKRKTYGESWSTGDTYNLSIGQGFLTVTPLQMLNAVNVVATSGVLLRPQIVHHVADASGLEIQRFEREAVRTLPVSQENWSLVRQGMESTVASGTAQRAQIDGVRVAGKTGTAQFCDDIMCGVGYEQPEHAWFAAFAPIERPEISLIVFIYNGGEGSTVAVPIARDILDYYFRRDETPL